MCISLSLYIYISIYLSLSLSLYIYIYIYLFLFSGRGISKRGSRTQESKSEALEAPTCKRVRSSLWKTQMRLLNLESFDSFGGNLHLTLHAWSHAPFPIPLFVACLEGPRATLPRERGVEGKVQGQVWHCPCCWRGSAGCIGPKAPNVQLLRLRKDLPAYGLDFERREFPLRALQAQKWHVYESRTFGAAWDTLFRYSSTPPGSVVHQQV